MQQEQVKSLFTECCVYNFLCQVCPVVEWLPCYSCHLGFETFRVCPFNPGLSGTDL